MSEIIIRTAQVFKAAQPSFEVTYGKDWVAVTNNCMSREDIGNSMGGEFLAWSTLGNRSIKELMGMIVTYKAEAARANQLVEKSTDLLSKLILKTEPRPWGAGR